MDQRTEMNWNGEIEPKPNVLLGTLGAIVGALLGAVLWVVLYEFGIIASIAGIAIVYLAGKGYALLSRGRISMKGVVISVVVSVIILVAAHFFSWGLDIYNELGDMYEITLFDAIKAVPEIAFTEELIVGFLRDLGIGLVLIGVGTATLVRQARGGN